MNSLAEYVHAYEYLPELVVGDFEYQNSVLVLESEEDKQIYEGYRNTYHWIAKCLKDLLLKDTSVIPELRDNKNGTAAKSGANLAYTTLELIRGIFKTKYFEEHIPFANALCLGDHNPALLWWWSVEYEKAVEGVLTRSNLAAKSTSGIFEKPRSKRTDFKEVNDKIKLLGDPNQPHEVDWGDQPFTATKLLEITAHKISLVDIVFRNSFYRRYQKAQTSHINGYRKNPNLIIPSISQSGQLVIFGDRPKNKTL